MKFQDVSSRATGRFRSSSRWRLLELTLEEALISGNARPEGILAALESSHAVGWVLEQREALAGKRVLLNLSGRGDKDMATIEAALGGSQ